MHYTTLIQVWLALMNALFCQAIQFLTSGSTGTLQHLPKSFSCTFGGENRKLLHAGWALWWFPLVNHEQISCQAAGIYQKSIVPKNLNNSTNRNTETYPSPIERNKNTGTLSVKGTSGNTFRTDVPDGSLTFVQPYTHVVFEQRIYLNVSNNH